MIFLILAIISSSAVGILLSYFHKRQSEILYIFLGNYLVASLISFFSRKNSISSIGSLEIFLGIFTGFLFFYNFIIYNKNIKINNLSLSVGVMRISLLVAVVISLIFFHETISLLTMIGIAVIISAFYLMSNVKSLSSLKLLLFLFFVTGMADASMKIYNEVGNGFNSLFLLVIFCSAFLFNLIWIIKEKKVVHFYSVLMGLFLGIPNQLNSFFFLKSLDYVKAPIAFPVNGAGVVVTCLLYDVLIFKKKYKRKEKWSLALLIIGIILLNLNLNSN